MITDLQDIATAQRALKPADRSADDWEITIHMPLSQLDQLISEHIRLEALRDAERRLSMAYVRLRALIPGAFDTPYAPTPEQVWTATEQALVKYKERLEEEHNDAVAKMKYLAQFIEGEDGTFTFPDGDSVPCKKASNG